MLPSAPSALPSAKMADSEFPWRGRRAALIVAHPGHELRIHHWLELARPLVIVLTDGSGHTGHSRIASTTRVLFAAGARAGAVCGRFTDAGIYELMLRGGFGGAADLLREIAGILAGEGIEYLAHDAIEGYNPSHDLCWHLAGAAALLAENVTHRKIRRFDFPLTGRPDECPAEMEAGAIRIALDDAALTRKLAAAEAYPELKAEVDAAIGKSGVAPFATEWLRPVRDWKADFADRDQRPFYEGHGEARRASGHYAEVIRREQHVMPLARSLWESASTT
jgi:hypothetical protein